jgi:putative ABC transport system permease protein
MNQDQRSTPPVTIFDNFLYDVRHGARMLTKNLSFTIVAIVTLLLGIGTNTAIFSVVESVLLRPLPFHDADRLFLVWARTDGASNAKIGASGPDVRDYQEQSRSFKYLAEFAPRFLYTWTGHGEPKTVVCTAISHNFFPALGISPVLGRLYTAQEYHTDGVQVVISTRFWKQQLGGDPNVIGRVLHLDDSAMTVIGVAPSIPGWFPDTDIWAKVVPDFSWMQLRNNKLLSVLGRLRDGVSRQQAEQELTAILRRSPEEPRNVSVRLVPLKEEIVGKVRTQFEIVMGAATLVLLVSCANVAYLLLARTFKRQQEIAVRLSMGANRVRILAQLVTENLLLASASAVLAVFVAFSVTRMLRNVTLANLPRFQEIGLDGRVLGFTCLIVLLISLLLAWAPSPILRRLDLIPILKTGRAEAGNSGRGSLKGLIIGEVCLATILLIFAGLLTRSFWNVEHVNAGFQREHVLTAFLRTNYFSQEGGIFYNELLARMSQTPGVRSAAVADCMPGVSALQSTLSFDDRANDPYNAPVADSCWVSGDFFQAIGTPLLQGRAFTARDDAHSLPVAIINEAMAREYWPNQDPIGRGLMVNFVGSGRQNASTLRFRKVVGVVGDIRHKGLDLPAGPAVYTPFLQDETNHDFPAMYLFVRTIGDPRTMAGAVRSQVHFTRPDQPIDLIRTMDDVHFQSLAPRRLAAALLGGFAVLSLVLSAIGIYGIVAYSVSQRTRELGLRKGLGAQNRDLVGMVMKEGLLLTGAGGVLGIAVSLLTTQIVSKLLFGIAPTDLLTFTTSVGLLLAASALGCFIPALRVGQVDPMTALREE